MALRLRDAVLSLLKSDIDTRFTAFELANRIVEKYPADYEQKKQNSRFITTDAELRQQIAAEIGSSRPRWQLRHPELKTTEGRPRRFYYSAQSASEQVEVVEGNITSAQTTDTTLELPQPREHDLYPLLAAYNLSEYGVHSKRIDEKRSSNTRGPRGNKWLHPDLVGLQVMGQDWDREVQECVAKHFDKRTKLWAFEVKLLVNSSNVRECFFQTVSNSSWANFGYLVAAEIEGDKTLRELRMLSAAHGIGVIQLDTENPAESQELIPAKERETIGWEMVNRLATENSDFMAYVTHVKHFYQTGVIRPVDWCLA